MTRRLQGPFFPLVVGTSTEVIPTWLMSGAMGWIAAFGQAGASLFPFLNGALAQAFGVQVMQPLIVAMMVVVMILWWILPRFAKTLDQTRSD